MSTTIDAQAVRDAFRRVSQALIREQEFLLSLDQEVGDGDLGITLAKIAAAWNDMLETTPLTDMGAFLANAGMIANRVGSSSLGTLIATALMRAGKEARGLAEMSPENLAVMVQAADQGVMERGKAQMGDKTVVDSLHPGALAFSAAIAESLDLAAAGAQFLQAAEEGLNRVTPLQSRIGRASWLGERSIGKVDPGCAALVVILKAVLAPPAP
jgi:phosphoenolpyruvate---glycerone phosphotransferase subunit DhaL